MIHLCAKKWVRGKKLPILIKNKLHMSTENWTKIKKWLTHKKLDLHMDVNKTLIPLDGASGKDQAAVINGSIAEIVEMGFDTYGNYTFKYTKKIPAYHLGIFVDRLITVAKCYNDDACINTKHLNAVPNVK